MVSSVSDGLAKCEWPQTSFETSNQRYTANVKNNKLIIPSIVSFIWFIGIVVARLESSTQFAFVVGIVSFFLTLVCLKDLAPNKWLRVYIALGFTLTLWVFPNLVSTLFFNIHNPAFRIPAFTVLAIYFLLFIEFEVIIAVGFLIPKPVRSSSIGEGIIVEIRNNTIYIFLTVLTFFVIPINSESIAFYFNEFLFTIILIELTKSIVNRILPLFIKLTR